jgi:hypothetical protein
MNKKWPIHLFEYHHDGAMWTVEIPAQSENDAKERIIRLQDAKYLGTLQMKLPVELGLFARIICWWQNRQTRLFS